MDPTTYDGTSQAVPIRDYLKSLERYFALKDTASQRKPTILRNMLVEPASDIFEAAIENGAIATPDELGEDAHFEAFYTNMKNWLIAQYDTDENKDRMRIDFHQMKIAKGESPQNVLVRLRSKVQRTSYVPAVRDQMVEQQFYAGIDPVMLNHARSMGRADLEVMTEHIQAFWETYRDPRAQEVKKVMRSPEVQIVRKEVVEDDRIDKLTQAMEKMSINLANLMRQQTPGPARIKRFDQRQEVKPTCFNCGEEGHYARDCQSETVRKAQPSHRTLRQGTNVVGSFEFVEDDDWENSDEELDNLIEVYPAEVRKRERKAPYARDNRVQIEPTPVVARAPVDVEPDAPMDAEPEVVPKEVRLAKEAKTDERRCLEEGGIDANQYHCWRTHRTMPNRPHPNPQRSDPDGRRY